MKTLILTIFSLFICQIAYGQASKTYVKSFSKNIPQNIILDLEGQVEIKEWDEPYLRVHSNVTVENASPVTLKELMLFGRYHLSSSLFNNSILIASNLGDLQVECNGQVVRETVSYTVFVPRYSVVADIHLEGDVVHDEVLISRR